jgi:hypothetical protein
VPATAAARLVERKILLPAVSVVRLQYGVYGWAAFFLVVAILNLAVGCWDLTIGRSESART